MNYVYVLQSLSNVERFYTGETLDLKRRLQENNDGKSIHTNKFKPWKIYCYFAMENNAKAFEEYLKRRRVDDF